MQNAVEVRKPKSSHINLLKDVRDATCFLLYQMGIFDLDKIDEIKDIFFLEKPHDRFHRMSRRNLLNAYISALGELSILTKIDANNQKQWTIHVNKFRSAIDDVFKGLYNFYLIKILNDLYRLIF